MALPTVAQLKAYCRVDGTSEDALFTLYLARATALVEGLLGRPITGAAQTVIVVPQCHPITGRYRLMLPYPFAAITSITDDEGDTVSSSEYTLDGQMGFLTFAEDATVPGYCTVTLTAGWSLQTGYATKAEPMIAQAITDTVADWHQRRNAGATSESESSASVSYSAGLGLPERVKAALDPLVRKGVR
jgi:uncharacterized phiE125 gp8 family phage protein